MGLQNMLNPTKSSIPITEPLRKGSSQSLGGVRGGLGGVRGGLGGERGERERQRSKGMEGGGCKQTYREARMQVGRQTERQTQASRDTGTCR